MTENPSSMTPVAPARRVKIAQVIFFALMTLYLARPAPIVEFLGSLFAGCDHAVETITEADALTYYQEGRYPWDGWIFLLWPASREIQNFIVAYALVFSVAWSGFVVFRRRMTFRADGLVLALALGLHLAAPPFFKPMPAMVGTLFGWPILTVVQTLLVVAGLIAFGIEVRRGLRRKIEAEGRTLS